MWSNEGENQVNEKINQFMYVDVKVTISFIFLHCGFLNSPFSYKSNFPFFTLFLVHRSFYSFSTLGSGLRWRQLMCHPFFFSYFSC